VQELESLDAVAEEYGMDAAVLRTTVDEYNKGVREGYDKLGKSIRSDVKPMERPPFYVCRCALCTIWVDQLRTFEVRNKGDVRQ
jgi:hypothetical protein